jgi:type IV pilus assembly protein PilE
MLDGRPGGWRAAAVHAACLRASIVATGAMNNRGVSKMYKFGNDDVAVSARFRQAGFTLIELMVVVAVVAILAMVALPSYQEQMRKARRGQAKADLVEYMQMAERVHTVSNSYTTFALNADQSRSPREAGATVRYTIAIAPAATASTITLVATPQGPQAQDRCGTLSLNQAGLKTNSTGLLRDCW